MAVAAATPALAADESITVNFSATNGTPTYRASGWIYGMTENGANPPDNFLPGREVPGHAGRRRAAGRRRLGAAAATTAGGTPPRAQAQRTAALGGKFVLLAHDLWGADGAAISRFPGDNGNWTDYDNFLTRLFNDVQAAGLTVEWDIWNEPNISIFWNRPQSQYFELWRRTYQRIRADVPEHAHRRARACAGVPSTGGWWTQYLDYVKANNVVPDIISWHSLPGDPVANVATANSTLDSRGIAHPRPYQINEYGASNEQNPGDGAWYIARLERAGADGLRANWAGGGNLHNDLASLLTRNSSGQYQTKGEWWVYNFYAARPARSRRSPRAVHYDAFATKAAGSAKILVGGGRTTGNVAVNLQRLDTTSGIVQNNQVRVRRAEHPVQQRRRRDRPGHRAGQRGDAVRQRHDGQRGAHQHQRHVHHHAAAPVGRHRRQGQQIVGGQSGRCARTCRTRAPPTARRCSCGTATAHQPALDATRRASNCRCTATSAWTPPAGAPTNGTPVIIWDCNGQTNQQWNVNADGTITGVQSGLCLDASAFGTANGTKIQLWQCLNGANQKWTLRT